MTTLAEQAADPELERKALAAGLLGIDAARRVGWAKFFEAFERVESLEEEVRQLRDERKYLRRSYSRLLGFIQGSGSPQTPLSAEELSKHFAAERMFRHDDAWGGGFAVGEAHRFMRKGMDEDAIVKHQQRKNTHHRQRRQLLSELRSVGKQHGHLTTIRRRLRADASVIVRCACSCGEASSSSTEHDVYEWRYDHLAQVGFGRSFAEHKAARKGEETQ